jgi:arylsulfatase A
MQHLPMRSLISRVLAFAAALLWTITATGHEQSPAQPPSVHPNIVIILADDLGYGDVGAFNPGSRIPTPTIDKLAREGMRFTDAHTNSSVCTPTRYGLLTGRYAWRTRLQRGVLWGEGAPLVEPGRLTLASMLKARGYRTAVFGKWHLGLGWEPRRGETPSTTTQNQVEWIDYARPFSGGPMAHGFDEFFGIAASLDMPPYVYLQNDRVAALPTEKLPGIPQGNPAFYRPGIASPGFQPESVLRDVTTRAVDYIRSRAGDAKRTPFLLYLALAAPHTPVMPTAAFRGRTGIGVYGDFVAETDGAIGQVLDALEQAGLSRDTLVLFTSDNGPAPIGGIAEAAKHGHDSSGGWRGVKAQLYEGGHRVPFVVRWPKVVAAGSTSRRLIGTTDIVATIADLVAVRLPSGAAEDSISFAATLKDPAAASSREEAFVHHSQDGSFGIRQGRWKLLLTGGSGSGNPPGVAGRQLYDLENDPKETKDVVSQHPDVVTRLETLLEVRRKTGRTRR